MAEENKTEIPTATETTDKAATPVAETIAIPTLAEDVAKLEQIDRLRAVVLRMQGGRHPNREIEDLLQRRLNLPLEEFQGPYVTRLVVTLMMVFIASTAIWAILWAIGNAMELNFVLNMVSTGMATLVAAIAGVAVFHPASVPDEKKLIAAIEAHMNELRMELGKSESAGNTSEEPGKAGDDGNKKSSTTVEADLKAASDQGSENGTPAPDTSVVTDKGSDDVSP
ncbi:MAG: hypothetical protein CVV41_13710 [Candidatus Riflebacteria bacterium HGW-Riflebacteria-1]|jgi:hypothetical protein|nr:MAG: hypothetical protein CVV41_13710 [Candidatus Riflebacteria bacterium HGW-Riflebacteria-1]